MKNQVDRANDHVRFSNTKMESAREVVMFAE